MTDTAAFVEFLVRADVLTFGDFTTKSGRATPYFLNFGRVRTGRQVATLGAFYADRVVDVFGRDVDVLFGPAYKGIPLAVATSVALAERHDLDVAFCFDLWLPEDFVPENRDGEVERFELWPLERALAVVRETDAFKFNCALVVIDLALRYGAISPDEPGYAEIRTALGRQTPASEP